ncbi:MAG: response regulator, partial [Gammaproteobacteria bacterium]|nr:response regulator [Gammaproteobacteria bacterium]
IKAGHHLLKLINEVLDLEKIESGCIDLSLEPISIVQVVNDCFSLIAPIAEERGIKVSHGEFNGYFIRADKIRFKQVLINLLSNAIKYNREHGEINLEVSPVNKTKLRITVSDTGNGIEEAKLAELFQPFNRLGVEGYDIEGSGIGLSIAKNLMELMGGSIGVDSEPGIGSQFWVELPMESFESNGEYDDTDEGIAENLAAVTERQHTVLYIEDNPANLKLVSHILSKRQHITLVTAHEPELGLELASYHHPELILLDINMPGMDGYQVLNILQSDDNLNDIPVLAITASAMPKDIERGKAAGFSDYLTKPLNIPDFLKAIDQHLK